MAENAEADRRLEADKLETFATSVLEQAGLDSDDAAIVADSLIDANLRGIDTHGVVRLDPYVERLEKRGMNRDPNPTVADHGEATAIVDADNGPGQVATRRAIEEAIERANTVGAAFIGVRRSNHFGTASYYTNYAAEQGYIGIAMTHAGPNVTPFGGSDPYFGTNPIAFAFPYDDFPVSLDMATSETAKGSVILAQEEGEEIPPEWAIDEDGEPITDPEQFHALRPMSGPKGYGLALVVDAFCGLLLDTVYGKDVPTMYDDMTEPEGLGHFVGAIDVEAFSNLNSFIGRFDSMAANLKRMDTTGDFDDILLPGEPEARKKTRRLEDGIPIGEGVWETLTELGEDYGVSQIE
jgi:ureidoglycolate dehydrogenase (NAD+)